VPDQLQAHIATALVKFLILLHALLPFVRRPSPTGDIDVRAAQSASIHGLVVVILLAMFFLLSLCLHLANTRLLPFKTITSFFNPFAPSILPPTQALDGAAADAQDSKVSSDTFLKSLPLAHLATLLNKSNSTIYRVFRDEREIYEQVLGQED